MKRFRSVVPLATLILCAGLGLPMLTACQRTEQAPTVSYTLLDGKKSTLESLRGRVVLVNFWATDCAPCIEEMPQIVATWRRFAPRGFETLAVSMSYDPPFAVSNFAQSRELPFGVVIDNTGEIARRFGNVSLTPTSVLINRRGEIVHRWVGKADFEALRGEIEQLLGDA